MFRDNRLHPWEQENPRFSEIYKQRSRTIQMARFPPDSIEIEIKCFYGVCKHG